MNPTKHVFDTQVIDNIVTQIKPQILYSKYSKKYNQTCLIKLADSKFYKQKDNILVKTSKESVPSITKLKDINKKEYEFKNSESKKYLTHLEVKEPENHQITYLSKSIFKEEVKKKNCKYVLDFNINYNSVDKKLPSISFIRDKFTNMNF